MVSFSISSRLPANTAEMLVNPVTLPPGRARLSTNPDATGSHTARKNDRDRSGSILRSQSIRGRGRNDHVNFEPD